MNKTVLVALPIVEYYSNMWDEYIQNFDILAKERNYTPVFYSDIIKSGAMEYGAMVGSIIGYMIERCQVLFIPMEVEKDGNPEIDAFKDIASHYGIQVIDENYLHNREITAEIIIQTGIKYWGMDRDLLCCSKRNRIIVEKRQILILLCCELIKKKGEINEQATLSNIGKAFSSPGKPDGWKYSTIIYARDTMKGLLPLTKKYNMDYVRLKNYIHDPNYLL